MLCHVADVVRDSVRQADLACRVGGEEFVTVCLDTDSAGAMRLAERMRAAIELHDVPIGSGREPIRCTVTLGVSRSFVSAHALDNAMQQADTALYRGKAAGRNRVEHSGNTGSASFAEMASKSASTA